MTRNAPSRFATVVAVLSATAAVVCVVVAASALVRTRPIPELGYLIIPGALVLAVGQIAVMVWLYRARHTGRPGSAGATARWLTNGLGGAGVAVVIALSAGGFIAAMTAIPPQGQPVRATAGCEYPLGEHGQITACVSREEYERVQVAGQRFVAGILLCFFTLHSAVALAARRNALNGRAEA